MAKVKLRGSALTARIVDRYFLFCCGHQIWDVSPEKMGFIIPHELRIAVPSQLLAYKSQGTPGEDDFYDIRAFEYELGNYEGIPLASNFFKVEESEIWPNDARGFYWAFGYPYQRQVIEESRIGAFQYCVSARYKGASASPHLHHLEIDVPDGFEPDGMSGGPVFYMGKRHNEDFLGLAGMTIRGGGDNLYFLASDVLFDLVTRTPLAST